MTQPAANQIESYEYPQTWPAVAGFALWRFGIMGVLVAMLVVVFYYLQKTNERSQELSDKMVTCITDATVTQRATAMILANLNTDLAKHQAWEEKQLDLILPIVNRIDQDNRNQTKQ